MQNCFVPNRCCWGGYPPHGNFGVGMKTADPRHSKQIDEVKPPRILTNSLLASIPVVLGFLAQDFLIFGQITAVTAFLIFLLAASLLLSFYGNHSDAHWLQKSLMGIVVCGQWVAIIWALLGIYWENLLGQTSWIFSILLVIAGFLVVLLGLRDIKLKDFPNTFTGLSIVCTALVIWHGLELWTIQIPGVSRQAIAVRQASGPRLVAVSVGKALEVKKIGDGALPRDPYKWSYQGEMGPEIWASLHDDFRVCATGIMQSPVDIPRKTKYSASEAQTNWLAERGDVRDSGQLMKVILSGKSISRVHNREYRLTEIHFHSPSEHQLSGLHYPIEIQFVHRSLDGKIAIFSVFGEVGSQNPELTKVLSGTSANGVKDTFQSPTLTVLSLLPRDRKTYEYRGSLTTPPCTEGVLWRVFAKPIEISAEQLATLRKIYPNNARPVRAMGQRKFWVDGEVAGH